MNNLITGVIGMLIVIVFLGYYAADIASVPLFLIIIGVLGLACADFYGSLKQRNTMSGRPGGNTPVGQGNTTPGNQDKNSETGE